MNKYTEESLSSQQSNFINSICKLTAISEMLKMYEPEFNQENQAKIWETHKGISQIIDEVVSECYGFQESINEIFENN